jgi:hypothetical protein
MNAGEHDRHRDDVGAYLLGALSDSEAQAFEAHLRTCHLCQDELADLRVAADALPRAVPQFEAPAELKQRVMAAVEAEAGVRAAEPSRRREARWGRVAALIGGRRRAAWAVAAVTIALAVAAGFGAAQLVGEDGGPRTLAATVDQSRIGDAQARLRLEDDGREGGTLRVSGLPTPRPGRTYQTWVARGPEVSPQATFEVDAAGRGVVAIAADLSDANAVLLTREPRGGSRVPSERPVMRVEL